jgi:GH25 family lysozyme M1 (1,4-beta-N-acetylmuramidase)
MTTATQYVDCSSNNGTPNVGAYAAAGHRRISVKSTEGTGYTWFGGQDVARAAHAHGLAVEYYHWLRPEFTARSQAEFFVRAVEKTWRAGDDLMDDFEASYNYATGGRVSDGSDSRRADQLAEFQARAHELLAKPRVYTGNWYLAGMGPHCQAECRRHDIVMSDYSNGTLPNPYRLHYVAHQFTDRARVAGFGGPVDYNRLLAPATPSPTTPATPATVQEVTDMFELLLVDGKAWYLACPGTFRHLTTKDQVLWAANSALCVNSAAIAKKQTSHYQLSSAHATARRQAYIGK